MKLYSSVGPNPRMVDMYLLEKGISIERTEVDMVGGENRRPDFLAVNTGGTLPALDIGDGVVISEVTAIFEYLEELHPEPCLLGKTASERATVRMWSRRIDLRITEPMAFAVHSGEAFEVFKGRMRLFPYAVEDLYAYAQDNMRWIDPQIAGRDYIAGATLSIADLNLFAHLDYYQHAGRPMPEDCRNLRAWYDRMARRESANASLHAIDRMMRGMR